MPRRAKSKSRKLKSRKTTRGGVTQSVVINIGDKQKRKARTYLKPNRIQGHNLMIPQLISTRQDPFDLATLGKLQQRQAEQDNLMVKQFEEVRLNQQQQAETLEDAKREVKALFSTPQVSFTTPSNIQRSLSMGSETSVESSKPGDNFQRKESTTADVTTQPTNQELQQNQPTILSKIDREKLLKQKKTLQQAKARAIKLDNLSKAQKMIREIQIIDIQLGTRAKAQTTIMEDEMGKVVVSPAQPKQPRKKKSESAEGSAEGGGLAL